MRRLALACVAGLLVSVLLLAQEQSSRAASAARREDAYRQNNLGVAHLEQYDYPRAVAAFQRALAARPDLASARLNLAIALLYDGKIETAEREAKTAVDQLPGKPEPHFVLGLIARAANRSADAAASFQKVIGLDEADAGSRVQLAQVRLGERQFAEAARLFEAALRLEPFNATAAYGRATALARGGDRKGGEAAMARFQSLRDNPAAITYSTTYLEQGRYGEAIASTGLEPELVDTAVPAVTFVDATAEMLPGMTGVRDVSLADIDRDGDVDVVLVGKDDVRLLRNGGGRFAPAPVIRVPSAVSALAGDYDNDGRPDLLVLTERALVLFHHKTDGSFRESAPALPRPATPARAAAFVDADHDGDLDILAGSQLLRNIGNGRFQDVTSEAGLTRLESPLAIVPTDFDNRRDVDLLVVSATAPPALFGNQRDGTFRDLAADVALPRSGRFTSVTAADVNKDLAPDFFFGRAGAAGVFALSARGGRFTLADAPAETAGADAAHFVDYDNDGLLDLLALTPKGPRLWRSTGAAWVDVSQRARASSLIAGSDTVASMAVADLDADGDEDVVARLASGAVRVWRNDGGNRHRSVRVRLNARVSNRDAVGAKVDLRAGSLRQRLETFATTPAVAPADLVFGLGTRGAADVVRVLWPAGILQAETSIAMPVTAIAELNRKPSSCPFLYTWSGARFEFLTDFLGGGELGYWVAPGVRNVPDPDEYVRIPPGMLAVRDGRYELRITNELEEALFVDRVELVAIDHPSGVDVHPNEGLRSPALRQPFTIHTVRGARPPLAALDEHGHDVLDRIAARDRRYVDDYRLSSIQGYADQHSLTIDTGALPSDARVLLLLTGWTDYAFSSDNVAAQQAGLAFQPPALEARDSSGHWRTVMPEVGLPVGRPQTVVLDVTPQTRRGSREFRIVTTLRVYWDEILIDVSEPAPVTVTRLDAQAAGLRWRGFSAETKPADTEPASYDYDRVSAHAPWKLMPGRYTRFGDVAPLLASSDDRFVVSAPGDEIALSFNAGALPSLAAGWSRTFLLYADGFSKEMNLHSASPDDLGPLPFHGMMAYPYAPPEQFPDTPEHRRYRDEYNTRVIGRRLPPLETTTLLLACVGGSSAGPPSRIRRFRLGKVWPTLPTQASSGCR